MGTHLAYIDSASGDADLLVGSEELNHAHDNKRRRSDRGHNNCGSIRLHSCTGTTIVERDDEEPGVIAPRARLE
jgi:hypothetical protein